MSDEYVQAESTQAGDSTQAPDFISAAEADAPQEPVAAPEAETATNADLLLAAHRAALEAERAVIESQYSEGLGIRETPKAETKVT